MPHDVPTLSPGPSEQQLVAPPSAAELRGAFSSLLDLTPTCVAIVDVHGLMVRLANPAFRAAASDPEIDPVGRTVEEIWPTEAGLELRALLEAAANGEPSRCEWLPGCGDDEWQRSFTAHAQCVAAGAGRVLLLILWETTEMQGARRQAERSRERAELIASVAADLNGGVDIGAVLGTAVRRAAELLGVEDASVWLLDAGGEDLRRTAERQAHGGREALPLRHLPSAQAVLRDHEARLVRREQAAPLERAWMTVRRLSAALGGAAAGAARGGRGPGPPDLAPGRDGRDERARAEPPRHGRRPGHPHPDGLQHRPDGARHRRSARLRSGASWHRRPRRARAGPARRGGARRGRSARGRHRVQRGAGGRGRLRALGRRRAPGAARREPVPARPPPRRGGDPGARAAGGWPGGGDAGGRGARPRRRTDRAGPALRAVPRDGARPAARRPRPRPVPRARDRARPRGRGAGGASRCGDAVPGGAAAPRRRRLRPADGHERVRD